MAIIEQKFVYRDGANSASAPITAFKLADLFADLSTGVEGDLAYAKDTDKVYKYTGAAWIEVGIVYTPPAGLVSQTAGTWTPVIGGLTSETGQTYSRQYGNWTKTGTLVHVDFDVALSLKGTITGNVALKGFPYVMAGNPRAGASVMWDNMVTAVTFMYIELEGGNTFGTFLCGVGATTAPFQIGTAYIGNNTRIRGSISYMTP